MWRSLNRIFDTFSLEGFGDPRFSTRTRSSASEPDDLGVRFRAHAAGRLQTPRSRTLCRCLKEVLSVQRLQPCERARPRVVVLFENRSFDNMLGRLYGPNDGKTFDGVVGKQLSNPIPRLG